MRVIIKEEVVTHWGMAMQLLNAGIMLDFGVELTSEKVISADGDELEFRIVYYTQHIEKSQSGNTLAARYTHVISPDLEALSEGAHVTPNKSEGGYM